MKEWKPGARLAALAALVRPGAVVCDVGTDHAYLPVLLTESGKCPRAVASDIAEGPLLRAEKTVREAGMTGKVTLVRTDGLSGLAGCGADDIVIAGMGGELIVQILSAAPFVRDPRIRLILQPMTRQEVLRKWLAENGFETLEERLVEDGKLYQILLCAYDGKARQITDAEAAVGPGNLASRSPLLGAHLDRLIRVWETRREGILTGGGDGREAEAMLRQLRQWRKEYTE